MYIIAIAWLYVAVLAAASDTTLIGGILTFVFYGVAPLSLFLWLFGTPARRRRSAQRALSERVGEDDRGDAGGDQ
jgi:membrane protein implicated in regulation of membrane protease activity